MTPEKFVRDHTRYTVIKHKDLTLAQRAALRALVDTHGVPTVEALVIEPDWPEYEPAWGMLECRMSGLVDKSRGFYGRMAARYGKRYREVRDQLKALTEAYRLLAHAGCAAIEAAGGKCDTPGVMLSQDPEYQSALKATRESLFEPAPGQLCDVLLMPRYLSAENGAKAALIGEFFVEDERQCRECDDETPFVEDCESCDCAGVVAIKHPIPWDTIKRIYEKAVDTLEVK